MNAHPNRSSAAYPYVGRCAAITSSLARRGSTSSAHATHALVIRPSTTRSTATVPRPTEIGMPWRSLVSAGRASSPRRSGSAKIAKKPIQLSSTTSLSGRRLTGAIKKRQRLARK